MAGTVLTLQVVDVRTRVPPRCLEALEWDETAAVVHLLLLLALPPLPYPVRLSLGLCPAHPMASRVWPPESGSHLELLRGRRLVRGRAFERLGGRVGVLGHLSGGSRGPLSGVGSRGLSGGRGGGGPRRTRTGWWVRDGTEVRHASTARRIFTHMFAKPRQVRVANMPDGM